MNTRLISIRIPEEMVLEAERVAEREGRSRSQVLVKWLRVGYEGEAGVPQKMRDDVGLARIPEVSMETLREIAAGKIPEEVCGYREANLIEGEWYECRLAKHDKRVRHQMVATGEELPPA